MREPRKVPFSIPVGVGGADGAVSFRFPGRMVTCTSATATFFISRDGGRVVDIGAGRELGDPASAEFGLLQLYNRTGSIITGEIVVSDEPIGKEQAVQASVTTSVSVSGQNKDTYTKGSGLFAIPGPGATYLGVDGGGQKRKSFAIKNREAAGSGNNVLVTGSNGQVMWELSPQEGHLIEGGGVIVVTGAGFNAVVEEVFYQLP